jgi:RNA polymerase sigma factor (sigma-70 family)
VVRPSRAEEAVEFGVSYALEARPEPQPQHRSMDTESAEWVRSLSATGPDREAAAARLYPVLLRAARSEVARRSGAHGINAQELAEVVEEAASDAVISILRKVAGFRGESRFSTWAYAFVIREVSSKLGRHGWRTHGVQLDVEAWSQLPGRLGAEPGQAAEARELLRAVRNAVDTVLTPHQRRIFSAIILNGTPLDVLVIELDMTRNAIYKTLFDARSRLRSHLIANGELQERHE